MHRAYLILLLVGMAFAGRTITTHCDARLGIPDSKVVEDIDRVVPPVEADNYVMLKWKHGDAKVGYYCAFADGTHEMGMDTPRDIYPDFMSRGPAYICTGIDNGDEIWWCANSSCSVVDGDACTVTVK